MPDSDFNVDLRDIRFAMLEGLPFAKLLATERFAELDRESLELLADEAYKFARDKIAPIDGPADRAGCRFEDGKVITPEGFGAAYRTFCESGYLAVSADDDHGGMGLPRLVGVGIGEMHIGACCSLSLLPGLTNAAASLISHHASEALQKAYLPRLINGEWQGTMCLTESQAGTAVGDIKTSAKPVDGQDYWMISGTKIFITAGDHDITPNHVHLVLARTPGAPAGFKGISLFLVPKFRLTEDGGVGDYNDVVCSGIEHKMGIHASPTCVMQFGEAGDCRGWLIGSEGEGLSCMFHMMNHARIGVGLQGLAMSAQAYLYAKAYAAERVQGTDVESFKDANAPRVTIDQHPDVRRMLLWQKAMTEGSRALLYQTVFFADLSESVAEADREYYRGLVEFLTPICKAYISDQAFEVTRLAMQTLGGYGYVAEYPVERFMRDVKIASIYEGTNGVQALDLMGRKLPAKGGLYFRNLMGLMQGFVKEQKEHAALGKEIAFLSKEIDRWGGSTMMLGAKGMSGDQRYPVLCATPYLEMSGNVVCSYLLLQQAVVAHDRLASLYAERGAADAEAQRALCADDPDAQFFFNKIETARFFAYNILPKNRAIAAQIESDDRSALNYLT